MKRNASILALTGTLLLGGFVGYQVNERIAAQNAQPAPVIQSAPASTIRASFTSSPKLMRTESEQNTVSVVKERQAGLVYVRVKEKSSRTSDLPFPFGPSQRENSGTGSGFFVNDQGDIITNSHVVEESSEIMIKVHGDKKEYSAKVIAIAPEYDLALIRVQGLDKSKIKPMPLGDSQKLDVGMKAIAMGAPFNLEFSVSEGIISSLERTVEIGSNSSQGAEQPVIQTDAAINPGNSGGPLLNSSGEVIGVNTQIATGGVGQSSGVGFAIPVNTVKRLMPLLQAGKGGRIQKPTMGIMMTDLKMFSEQQRKKYNLPEAGALVQRVYPGSPAAAAGVRGGTQDSMVTMGRNQVTGEPISYATDGDVIVSVDGQAISTVEELRTAVLGKNLNESLKLGLLRKGKRLDVTLTLKPYTIPQDQ